MIHEYIYNRPKKKILKIDETLKTHPEFTIDELEKINESRIKYNSRRKLVGLLVATTKDGCHEFSIGFSLCCLKKDKFNQDLAMKLAIQRANGWLSSDQDASKEIPSSIVKQLKNFIARSKAYYQTKQIHQADFVYPTPIKKWGHIFTKDIMPYVKPNK